MLTLRQLKEMKPDTIFATGETVDGYHGANMTGSGQKLRWVATRGGIHDWAIYIAPEDWDEEEIKRMGDKVHDRDTVQKFMPCGGR